MRGVFLFPLLAVLALFLAARVTPYPELEEFRLEHPGVVLSDRHGIEFAARPTRTGTYRFDLAEDTIPDHVFEAVIASEDRRFLWHPGVDPVAVASRILRSSGRAEAGSGGATIAIQLARMVRLNGAGGRTVWRDVWNALRIRSRVRPRELLTLYVNRVPFGFLADGIEAASRYWLGKSAREIDPREAYLLFTIPRNPSRYALDRSSGHAVEAALRSANRAGRVFSRSALETVVERAVGDSRSAGTSQRFLRDVTDARSGLGHVADRITQAQPVRDSRTSVDLAVQAVVRDELAEALRETEGNRIADAAAIVLDTRTNEVRAYIGARPGDGSYGGSFIDAVQVPRSPGSTLKPFLFALAFERGYTPDTVLHDVPLRFGTDEVFIPFNFNNRFNGPVTAAVALGSSLNVPAVALYDSIGQTDFLRYMTNLGLATVVSETPRAGLGAVLGAARTRLDELVSAYAALARGGLVMPIVFTSSPCCAPSVAYRGISERAALQVTHILSSSVYRHLGFPADSFLHDHDGVILKTGTASQFTDIVAVAADQSFTVGVWMGNLDGSTVIGEPGSSLPARVALNVLSRARASR